MDIKSIDYVSTALSRITQQYRNKPKFVELVSEYARLVEEYLEEPASKIFDILDIDLMEGHNLDVIGDIVGQPRVLVDYDLLTFFGFDGAPASGTFGDVNNSAIGERFVSAFEDPAGEKTLSDPEYRIFIKAKILKNYSDSTEEDLAESIKLILGAEQVKIDESTMSLDIGVLGTISDNDLALIQNYDIIPRPTGVEIASVYEYGLLEFDGFSGEIAFPSTTDFDVGASDFEIRTKIKTTNASQVVLSKEDSVNHTTPSYSIFIENGTVRFGYSPSDGTLIEFDSGFEVADNAIHSISIKRESSLLTITVDEKISTNTIASNPFTGTADFLKISKTDFEIIGFNAAKVYGAGSPSVNDNYKKTGTGVSGRPIFTRKDASGIILNIKLPPPFSSYVWTISDEDAVPATYTITSSLEYPPSSGWSVGPGAIDPAPNVDVFSLFSGLILDTSITIGGVQKGKWLLTEGTGTTATDTSGNGNDGTITDPNWVTSLS